MKKSLAILIPLYGGVPAKAYQSVIKFVSNVSKDYEALIFTSQSCYLAENRNHLLRSFLKVHKEKPIDYVLWIDSDIEFTLEDVNKLSGASDKNPDAIVSGVYLNNINGDIVPMVMRFNEEKKLHENITIKELIDAADKEQLVEADAAGLGFVLLPGRIMLDLVVRQRERLFSYGENAHGEMIGEDTKFFKDAKSLGYKLLVEPLAKVGHVKNISL